MYIGIQYNADAWSADVLIRRNGTIQTLALQTLAMAIAITIMCQSLKCQCLNSANFHVAEVPTNMNNYTLPL